MLEGSEPQNYRIALDRQHRLEGVVNDRDFEFPQIRRDLKFTGLPLFSVKGRHGQELMN